MLSPAHYLYLIIGCGVAAIGAAQAIRRLDARGSLAIVSEDAAGFYSRPGLAFYLTGEIPEEILYPIPKDELKQLDLDWIVDRVTRIDPAEHHVWMERRGAVTYERLLIATGSVAAAAVYFADLLHGSPGAACQNQLLVKVPRFGKIRKLNLLDRNK
jgi:NADPH-dependent 2,4-dienoyl-CoA reductase/sulfur reductase-like enzyme